jgi:hypothetical protein
MFNLRRAEVGQLFQVNKRAMLNSKFRYVEAV